MIRDECNNILRHLIKKWEISLSDEEGPSRWPLTVANLDGTQVNSSTARSEITEHMIKTCIMWLKIDVISADIL